MQRHSDMIRSFGDAGTACARALTNLSGQKIDREAVYKWRETDSIPAQYWSLFVEAAKVEGITDVTLEALATAAAKRAA